MAAHSTTLATTLNALNIDLSRRFSKREVGRPESNRKIIALEKRLHESFQQTFEVGEARPLINKQSLDLMEHGRMR